MLWSQVMKEWEANPWLDQLQKNLLFWLQLLALIFLFFSLIKPYWYSSGLKGDKLIFIVDTSASMSAQLENQTIFDKKKDEMKEMIAKLNNQSVTIIAANKQPQILVKDEMNKGFLYDVIEQLSITYEHENLDMAINLANAIADEKSVIHIFSDGVDYDYINSKITDYHAEVHNLEEKIENVSLKFFGVVLNEATMDGVAVVENQTEREKEINIIISSEKEKLFEQFFTIEPETELMIPITELPVKDYYLAEIKTDDQYTVDNSWTTIMDNDSPIIFAIGEVNPFIIKGFESVGAQVVQLANIQDVKPNSILLTEDRELLKSPSHPVFFVENEENANVQVSSQVQQEKDEIFSYVEMSNVYIEKANNEEITDLNTIAKSGSLSLIQKGMINNYPIIALRFPIAYSDWPLHPNFPIFLYNSYQWLKRETNYLGYFQPGEERWINLPDVQQLNIFTDDGENLYSVQLEHELFRAPNLPGLYQAVMDNDLLYFSVLLDDRERRLDFSDSFSINEHLTTEILTETAIYDQLWFYFTLIAFILLLLEWEVYRKNVSI